MVFIFDGKSIGKVDRRTHHQFLMESPTDSVGFSTEFPSSFFPLEIPTELRWNFRQKLPEFFKKNFLIFYKTERERTLGERNFSKERANARRETTKKMEKKVEGEP